MLRLALNAHPAIGVPAETHYFPDIYERYSARGGDGWLVAIDAFMTRCDERLIPAVADLAGSRDALRLGGVDYAGLLALPLSQWATAQGKQHWGEKTPTHIFFGQEIIELFPTAKVIALQRDPRAVVASLNRFKYSPDDTVLNAKLWRDVWTTGRSLMTHAVPANQLLEVRYEDLVTQPERTLTEVCRFLGEEFAPAMLGFGESTDDYVLDVLSPKLRGPIEAQVVDWASRLTPHDVAMIEMVCRTPMEALGYARVGRKTNLAERGEVAAKLTYARIKQLQNRSERYHTVGYRPMERFRRHQAVGQDAARTADVR